MAITEPGENDQPVGTAPTGRSGELYVNSTWSGMYGTIGTVGQFTLTNEWLGYEPTFEDPREGSLATRLTAGQFRRLHADESPVARRGSRRFSGRSRVIAGAAPRRRAYARRMCGRYTNTAGVQELNERFKVPIPGEAGTRRYNVAPTDEVLAIVSPKGRPEARLLRWGLIPSWAKDTKAPTR